MVTHESTHFRPLVEEFFTETADTQNPWIQKVNERGAEKLARIARVQPGNKIVDIGSGTGIATRYMAAKAGARGEVVGIDIVPKMVEIATKSDPLGATYSLMSGDSLKFAQDSVDKVTYGQSLPYLISPENSLRDAYRILKPGGTCLIACQQRSIATPAQELFFSLLRSLESHHPVHLPRLSAVRATYGEPQVLKELLETAGFTAISTSHKVMECTVTDFDEWLQVISGLGPYPYLLLRGLGQSKRDLLAASMNQKLQECSEPALTVRIGFTFARGVKRSVHHRTHKQSNLEDSTKHTRTKHS